VTRARKRYGQHFLAPAWADKVLEAIAPAPGDRFLEIGPGPGALTLRLAARVRHVTAIEVDRDLAAELGPRLPPNVDLIAADFLDVDLGPLLAAGPLRVAGNLPYNISTPILFKLLAASDCLRQGYGGPPERSAEAEGRAHGRTRALVDATVMLQREVADRLAARAGTKEYGVLTIFTAVHADVSRVLTLPPGAFRPAPKVTSAVVRLSFNAPRVPSDLRQVFDAMVRSMFTQRRKTLGNALRPFADSAGIEAGVALRQAGIEPIRRPETLELPELIRLAESLRAGNP
jgi:16S rRNA (adenine1518-N6/adenine1519-N6)-dimethyltransferase